MTFAPLEPVASVAPPATQRSRHPIVRRECACDGGPGSCPECAGQEDRTVTVQPKLRVGAAHDPLEREADEIADHVTRTAATQSAVGDLWAGLAAPASVSDVVSSGGTPLEEATRRQMEEKFGHDFSHVRVHADPAAAQSAETIAATAYTVGEHVVFGTGSYAPDTGPGRRLLAHELAHVVQQEDPG